MYNHITNDWGDKKPHDITLMYARLIPGPLPKNYLKQWLIDNPDTDVVQFHHFFYHFTLRWFPADPEKVRKLVGYGATVSIKALEKFEAGVRLCTLKAGGYCTWTTAITTPPSGCPPKAYRQLYGFHPEIRCQKGKRTGLTSPTRREEAMMFLGRQLDWNRALWAIF